MLITSKKTYRASEWAKSASSKPFKCRCTPIHYSKKCTISPVFPCLCHSCNGRRITRRVTLERPPCPTFAPMGTGWVINALAIATRLLQKGHARMPSLCDNGGYPSGRFPALAWAGLSLSLVHLAKMTKWWHSPIAQSLY